MKKQILKYHIPVIILVIIFAVSFSMLNYVGNEGFNPTDEGVVLAQSWRIINGEVPHKDFISIRPAASGYLHAVNFIFPGPLVTNARWFVLFQFFLIALVMSGFVFKILSEKYKNPKPAMFLALLTAGFTLTTLNYNLYSWTTIDTVFWSVLAMPLILKSKKTWYNVTGLIFLSFAALSRQTFVLVAAAGFVYVFLSYKKDLRKSIPVILAGASPFFAYLILLIANSATGDFLQQMTGRTEFFETAIVQFVKRFATGLSTPLNIVCFIVSVVIFLNRKHDIRRVFFEKGFHAIIAVIYSVFAVFHSIRYFNAPRLNISTLPFELFFMLLFLSILHWVILPQSKELRKISIAVLFISWVSAISLGDNTPVFATGILFIMIMSLSADIFLFQPTKISAIMKNQLLAVSVSLFLVVSGYFSQERLNYRDSSSKKLVNGLKSASVEFGSIRTNPAMVEYYSELREILDTLPDANNNTIVFPHNAMFYPVMKTRNPMSLDWLIENEYVGQEERIKSDLKNLKQRDLTYFIVDRKDIRVICDLVTLRFYKDDPVYNFIINNCVELNSEYEFFAVYRLKRD